MKDSRARTGIASFVFAILLLIFNWPVMSIPGAGGLLPWLFGAWGLAIALLALAAFLGCRCERRRAGSLPEPGGGGGVLPDLPTEGLDDRPGCGDV